MLIIDCGEQAPDRIRPSVLLDLIRATMDKGMKGEVGVEEDGSKGRICWIRVSITEVHAEDGWIFGFRWLIHPIGELVGCGGERERERERERGRVGKILDLP